MAVVVVVAVVVGIGLCWIWMLGSVCLGLVTRVGGGGLLLRRR